MIHSYFVRTVARLAIISGLALALSTPAPQAEPDPTADPAGAAPEFRDDDPPEYRKPSREHFARYRDDRLSAEPTTRARALRALAALAGPQATPLLADSLRTEDDPTVREALVAALVPRDAAALLRALSPALEPKSSAAHAARVLDYLDRCEQDAGIDALLALTGHLDAPVAGRARKRLQALRKTAVPILVKTGQRCSGGSRLAIVRVLGEIGDKRATPWICHAFLWDSERDERQSVARAALKGIGLPGVPMMIDALNQTSSAVLGRALQEIAGVEISMDRADHWRKWLKANAGKIEMEERRRFPEDFPNAPANEEEPPK